MREDQQDMPMRALETGYQEAGAYEARDLLGAPMMSAPVIKAAPMASALAGRGNDDAKARNKDGQFFPTERELTVGLLRAEDFLQRPRALHEPHCGEGHLAEVLVEAGHIVTGADLHLRGPAPTGWQRADRPVDWLAINPESIQADAIVMNPPFGSAHAHIRQALLTPVSYVYCLLPANFFFTRYGQKLWRETGMARFYACGWRPDFTGGGGGMVNVGWGVWVVQRPAPRTDFIAMEKPASTQLEGLF